MRCFTFVETFTATCTRVTYLLLHVGVWENLRRSFCFDPLTHQHTLYSNKLKGPQVVSFSLKRFRSSLPCHNKWKSCNYTDTECHYKHWNIRFHPAELVELLSTGLNIFTIKSWIRVLTATRKQNLQHHAFRKKILFWMSCFWVQTINHVIKFTDAVIWTLHQSV